MSFAYPGKEQGVEEPYLASSSLSESPHDLPAPAELQRRLEPQAATVPASGLSLAPGSAPWAPALGS